MKLYITILCILLLNFTNSVEAYVGPGAGFAFLSSFFLLAISFAIAVFYCFSWPLRFIFRALWRKKRHKSQVKRVIILGLDGMDPKLTEKFIDEGKMPHFSQLREQGTFAPLATSCPSISPVAWSSFATGVEPSHHNIFDFITRDPCTYSPMLSSSEICKASKTFGLGKYQIPLAKPTMKLLRKSQPFWKILGKHGVFSSILRVPITFPAEKFEGVLLSGMCVPDLQGTQGTFSFYTTNAEKAQKTTGNRYHVSIKNNSIETYLCGPNNDLLKAGGQLRAPLAIRIEPQQACANIQIGSEKLTLPVKTYSPWIRIVFRPGLGVKIHGICRLYINSLVPHFELYVTPIHIDPENPALPISHPFIYSIYLAKLLGPYATLGLAEDTSALDEGVIDEDAFLQQAYFFYQERERMFFKALERTPQGLCTCVFDTTDRIQHMFFRCLDETHPANKNKETQKYKDVIENLYVRMDELLGKLSTKIDDKTVLLVISDHGFTHFKRAVNLNTWLFQNDYLALKAGTTSKDWFDNVDWSKTRAFSLGLTGLFINRKGRESRGIVNEGKELKMLKRELIDKLSRLKDEQNGVAAICRVVDTQTHCPGPYTYDAPDLLIGYNVGYRNSWACANGQVTENVFEDNTKHWSGDHCVDPQLVPGILFSNRVINTQTPHIKDIAPTVLQLFGIDIPDYISGKALI